MLRKSEKTNYFGYKVEPAQNPFTGIMSFQHFRDETMYNDIVVKPENNFCETEHVECYPIPSYHKDTGREEGYYPDTSVVYIRVLWKEFEPKQGEFNYQLIQDIIDEAKAHNQTLVFRLLPHSTRASDDVPDWLKELIPCPERPDGLRLKDSPTDPLFLKLFANAIKEIAIHFDDDPTLEAFDVSNPGAWGEGELSFLASYKKEDLDEFYQVYIDYFKKTRLICQVSRPDLVRRIGAEREIGWRADGLGSPRHTYEYYPGKIAQFPNLWQTSPISFESYWWLCEWQRQGWDLDEIISITLKWHISSFNPKSMPIPFEWQDKIDYWVSKMGYHYQIDYFKFPEVADKGDELELKLGIDNVGVAPMYYQYPLIVRLVKGDEIHEYATDIDIRTWLPGKSLEKIIYKLPEDINSGDYDIEIGIRMSNAPDLYFCTDAERNGYFYKVGKVKIN